MVEPSHPVKVCDRRERLEPSFFQGKQIELAPLVDWEHVQDDGGPSIVNRNRSVTFLADLARPGRMLPRELVDS